MSGETTARLDTFHAPDLDSSWGLTGKAAVVCSELERRLMAGEYRFGETLPTARLLIEFDISRAPLTSALNQLRSAGYLRIIPQVGSQVIIPTTQEVADFYLMFSLVERGMARLAAQRRTLEQAAFLKETCRQMDEIDVSGTSPSEAYIDLLLMYHLKIHDAAASKYEVLRARSYRNLATFFLRNGMPENPDKILPQANVLRMAVTEAIVSGLPDAAEKAMAEYILVSI